MVCWSKTGQQRHGGLFRSMVKQGGALIGTRLGDGQTEGQRGLEFGYLCTQGCLPVLASASVKALMPHFIGLLGVYWVEPNLPWNPTMVSSADRPWKG